MDQLTIRQLVTPQVATDFLNRSEEARKKANIETVNRTLRNAKVSQYARAMTAGLWDGRTHQGIAISPEGFVVDGQHRLFAIIESGVSCEMLVTYNVPLEAQVVMDDGIRRAAHDFSRFSSTHLAIVRRLIASSTYRSNAELNELAGIYADAIDFVAPSQGGGSGHTKKITTASVLSVVARAYYTKDRVRLREFIEILRTGRPNNLAYDGAALMLREWLVNGRTTVRGSKELERVIQGKTAYCLLAFLERRDIKRVLDLDPTVVFKIIGQA